MRILVTGATGQLGSAVLQELKLQKHTVTGCGRGRIGLYPLDIRDEAAVKHCFDMWHPDAVIHCAAWTAVDAAETNPQEAWAVNRDGTRNVAECCRKFGSKLIYISTDYVFGDQKQTPWLPGEIPSEPRNIYGQTKLAGEQEVQKNLDAYFILRTGWLFGGQGNHFVRTMLRLAESQNSVRVVNDQVGRPTYSRDLARLLAQIVHSERYGCYHATNEGRFVSWYEFAEEIFRQAGKTVSVLPISSEQYEAKALRPHNSRMDTSKLAEAGFFLLPDWEDALGRYLGKMEALCYGQVDG